MNIVIFPFGPVKIIYWVKVTLGTVCSTDCRYCGFRIGMIGTYEYVQYYDQRLVGARAFGVSTHRKHSRCYIAFNSVVRSCDKLLIE